MSTDNLPNIGEVATTEIDGLAIRYVRGNAPGNVPVLLTAPWPESIYSFYRLIPLLANDYPFLAVDLPGFGHSLSRPDVMAPEAMGDFLIKLFRHFRINKAHAITPDVGTAAILFTASKQPALFESLVIGGAVMQPDLAGGTLKDLIFSPQGYLANVGADGVKPYLDHAAELTPAAIIEDFRAASAGQRLEEATQFVRAYIPDSPKLEPLLSKIKIPALIIAGKNDVIVPAVNGQFLVDRLPNNQYVLLNAEHRAWEEAATEYNEKIISWLSGGYHLLKKN